MAEFHRVISSSAPRQYGERVGTSASFDSTNAPHYGPELLPANVQAQGHFQPQRKLVLCFDGTGNKFRGDDSDSNILKLFRCLDREAADQYHYYQPGIGTYVVSTSISHTGVRARFRSWYLKAKDSAVGSSFDQHVVGGYRFLMRYYHPGDDIYFFGFSRGAYVARFLAEMLDYVGLLSHGNEEMVNFAWKAFSQWQSRQSDDSPQGHEKRHEMYQFMKAFRETFSRPIKRIRFLGLFDTVNSVPRFEAAWMQRSKFPYTARSSAKVIRHCVSIDERRAKFRQDLMYQKPPEEHRKHRHQVLHDLHEKYRARRSSVTQPDGVDRGRRATLAPPEEHAFRPHSRSMSRATRSTADCRSAVLHTDDCCDSDDEQDIDEIWFAPRHRILTHNRGGHGDVGGGWEIIPGSKSASHVPLAYMVRQAKKAGLVFDNEKLVEMGLAEVAGQVETNVDNGVGLDNGQGDQFSTIRIDVSGPSPTSPKKDNNVDDHAETHPGRENWSHFNITDFAEKAATHQTDQTHHRHRPFHDIMHKAHVARIHDSLEFGSGLGALQVLSWKIMEYLPFRRMDLQPDGSWKPIRWPLPGGETRDIPSTARVHGSVIRRMNNDSSYRPGNLIIGGGGRCKRRAPEEYGIGEWECVEAYGDPIDEVWVKKATPPASS